MLRIAGWVLLLGGLLSALSARGDSGSPPISTAEEPFIQTRSGLRFQDLRPGRERPARAGDTVEVHYHLRLTNGQKVDSSIDRGQPFSFRLGGGQVIKGMEEGLTGMRIGGKRLLIVPSKLGYGDRGVPPVIPAKADLIIEVELLRIK